MSSFLMYAKPVLHGQVDNTLHPQGLNKIVLFVTEQRPQAAHSRQPSDTEHV